MVKPIVQPELLSPLDFLHSRPGGLGKPYFEQLVPKAVSLAIRLYQDRKEAFLREDLVEKKEELDVMANRYGLLANCSRLRLTTLGFSWLAA